MKHDLILRPFENQPNLPLYMAAAPKRAARGREEDILLISLGFAGGTKSPEAEVRMWQERLAVLYFQTSGSVTNALKLVVETLNKPLFQENDRFEEASTWRTANLCLVVAHHDSLIVAQSGRSRVMLIGRDGRTLLFDPSLDSRGLGVNALPKPRFFQSPLSDGDTLLLAQDFPEAWLTLPLTSTQSDLLWDRLNQAASPTSACSLVEIHAGSGKVRSGEPVHYALPAGQAEASSEAETASAPQDDAVQAAVDELSAAEPLESVEPQPPEEEPRKPVLAEDLFGHLPIAPKVITEEEENAIEDIPAEELPQAVQEPITEITPDTASEAQESPAVPAEDQPEPPILQAEISEPPAVESQPPTDATRPKPAIPIEQIKQGALNGVARGAGWLRKVEDKAASAMGEDSDNPLEIVAPITQLPVSLKLVISILVPMIVVALAAMLFNSRGLESQYQYLMAQAQAAAANAAQMKTPDQQREGWNQVLGWLDQADDHRVSAEAAALREKAQAALDGLDGAVRLVYKPAFDAALFPELSIRSIIPINNDLYLLDGKSGKVLHMGLKSGKYEQDTSFVCGPGSYAGVSVGKLVDTVVVPINNPAKAPVLGIDADGNILYCAIGKTPVAASLIPPAAGWGKIQSIAFDSGRLFVLDPVNNVVWIYRGFSTNFDREPDSYFEEVPTRLSTAVGLAVGGDELFILYEDGHASHCLASNVTAELECQDPYLYQDKRAGVPALDFTSLRFSRLAYSPPPDPSIYFLEPDQAELYQFSLRLNLNRVLRSSGGSDVLPRGQVTAFSVSASRAVFLAFGNALYTAVLP